MTLRTNLAGWVDREAATVERLPSASSITPMQGEHDEAVQYQPADTGHRDSRTAPRRSIVVVLPDRHTLTRGRLSQLMATIDNGECDIVVACAGRPSNLSMLQSTLRYAQFLLEPTGATAEELRVSALRQASGDIIMMIDGVASQTGRTASQPHR